MLKIIIYGYTDLGSKIANILSSLEYEIIIVDFVEENYKKAKKDGFKAYKKDLLRDEELIKIGILDDIEAFYCVSSSKNNNFFVTLSSRNLNKTMKIISQSDNKQDDKKMYLAGANQVINPYEIGATKIFRILEKPFVSHILNNIIFAKEDLNIEEFTISSTSFLNGRYLDEFDFAKDFDIVLIGILDKELGNEFIFNYHSSKHKIDTDDTLVVMGQKENLGKFSQYLERESI